MTTRATRLSLGFIVTGLMTASLGAFAVEGAEIGLAPPGSFSLPESPSEAPEKPAAAESITQSTSDTIEGFTGVNCQISGTNLATGYLRRFFLSADHSINDPIAVNSVDIGIENDTAAVSGACAGNPITVNVYRIPTGADFVYANMELVETANFSLGGTTGGTVVNVPMPGPGGLQPATHDLVVEWVSCDNFTAGGGGNLFPGANDDGQTQPSYVAAADCGINQPVTLDSLGFPNSHNVLTVNGNTTEGDTPGDNRATFSVSKIFTDGNDEDEVTVSIDCNTGLILDQDKKLGNGDTVEFVVTSFSSGSLNCTITEDGETGYLAEYDTGVTTNSVSCAYDTVFDGDAGTCTITNTPAPVEIVVYKEWILEGPINDFDQGYQIDLFCQASGMTGPNAHYDGDEVCSVSGLSGPSNHWHGYDFSVGDASFKWMITPLFPSSSCYAVENFKVDFVEVENGCGNLMASAGSGAACTITNTVFFEGVPTLGQYGMALLALLMLGMGFVSFRRFS